MFDAAFARLEQVCERTRAELASYREQRPGDTDAAFLEQSVREFVRAGMEAEDHRPGLRMMALSVYSLVVKCAEVSHLRERVAYLADQLDMRGDALQISWNKIDELEASSQP
jgi:hypothetical protein